MEKSLENERAKRPWSNLHGKRKPGASLPLTDDARYRSLVMRFLRLQCEMRGCSLEALPQEDLTRLGVGFRRNEFNVLLIDVHPPAGQDKLSAMMKALRQALPAWEEEAQGAGRSQYPGRGKRDTSRKGRLRNIKKAREGTDQPL